jgi:hypothetical protein
VKAEDYQLLFKAARGCKSECEKEWNVAEMWRRKMVTWANWKGRTPIIVHIEGDIGLIG